MKVFKLVIMLLALAIISTTAQAAVDTGDDTTPNTDENPDDAPACGLGGGATCEFFNAWVDDPNGNVYFEYGFALYNQGQPQSTSASSSGCFNDQYGLESCLCSVTLTGEGFSQALYEGLEMSQVLSIPISALPTAPDGMLDFEVRAQFSQGGTSCESGIYSEENISTARIRLDAVSGQYPGHQDPPSLTSPFLILGEQLGKVTLGWDSANLEKGFYVYRREAGRPWEKIATLEANTQQYLDTTALETYYQYKVIPFNEFGSGLASDIASITTSNEHTLVAAKMLEAELIDDGRVLLQWTTRSKTSKQFSIERKLGAYGEYSEIALLPATARYLTDWTQSAPDINTSYFYRVVAIDGQKRAASDEISIVFSQAHSRTLGPLPDYCDNLDVDGDGVTTQGDALLIVSDLRLNGAHEVNVSTQYYDVNRDSLVSLNDALEIVSALRNGECQHPSFAALEALTPDGSTEQTATPAIPTPINIQVVPDLLYPRGGTVAAIGFKLQSEIPAPGYQPTMEYRIIGHRMRPLTGHTGWSNYFYKTGTANTPSVGINFLDPRELLIESSLEELNQMSFAIEISQRWNTPSGSKWVSAYQAFSYQQLLFGLLATPEDVSDSHCGDGLLDTSRGEQCDHGQNNGMGLGSYCLPNCRQVETSCYFDSAREDCSGLSYFMQWHNPNTNNGLRSEAEAPQTPLLPQEPQLLNESELSIPSIADTIQYANIDGDKENLLDACVRKADGIWCALRTEFGFQSPVKWTADYSDSHEWLKGTTINSSHYKTMKLVDLNADGKADICARGVDGLWCAFSSGERFETARLLNRYFSDNYGFREESKWSSIHFGNVNGDAQGLPEVCGRLMNYGLFCASGDGSHLSYNRWWLRSALGGSADINQLLGSSITLSDLNGDGIADLCGSIAGDIHCSFSNGNSLEPLSRWFTGGRELELLISSGGRLPIADINADGLADLCYSMNEAASCLLSSGNSFYLQ